MARVFGFLRAINVGGHVVTMAELRRILRDLDGVETFIASGNIIFESKARRLDRLEETIAARLERGLGYPVATFLRTEGELGALAACRPFSPAKLRDAHALNVGFLAAPPPASAREALGRLSSRLDEFHVAGREIHWLTRTPASDSRISGAVLERAIGASSTFRNVRTIARLATRYGLAPAEG